MSHVPRRSISLKQCWQTICIAIADSPGTLFLLGTGLTGIARLLSDAWNSSLEADQFSNQAVVFGVGGVGIGGR